MKRRLSLSSFVIVILLFSFTFDSFASTSATVNTAVLNVRSGPSTGHARITTITQGNTYKVLESKNGWYRLDLGSTQGWAHGGFLKINSQAPEGTGTTTATVTTTVLNVRTGPSTNYAKVTTIGLGKNYRVIESRNGWHKLDLGNVQGWAHGDFLKVTAAANPGPTPAPTPNPTPTPAPEPSPAPQTPSTPDANTNQPLGLVTINTSVLNVRSSASTSGKLLGTVKKDQNYYYQEASNGWYKIDGSSISGWVHGGYVINTPNPYIGASGTNVSSTVTVNTNLLNLRSKPTIQSSIITQLTRNSSYSVLESTPGWHKIKYNNTEGWVSSDYVIIKSVSLAKNTVNADDIKVLETYTKNRIAIPVVEKVFSPNSPITLDPVYVSVKEDGILKLTIKEAGITSPFNGVVSNNTAVTNINAQALDKDILITLGLKEDINFTVTTVKRKNTSDLFSTNLRTYIVIDFDKAIESTTEESTEEVSEETVDLITNAQGKTKSNYLIVLDPGHGGSDPGAQSGGYQEKAYNLDVALRLQKILQEQGYDLYMTRTTDVYHSILNRADNANILSADLFLSIHMNSYMQSTQGTETLYNRDALQSGERFASIIQKNMVQTLQRPDRGIVNRPDLGVLNSTYMPAALAELLFMSNPTDLAMLNQESVIQSAAESLAKSINEYLGFE